MLARRTIWIAAAVVGSACCAGPTFAQEAKIDTLNGMFAALQRCWQAPALTRGAPGMQITVMVSFRRDGSIFGKPKITFESEEGTDDERLAYRIAVMETLQRCTPLPLTESLGGAIAGRPMTMRFDDRRNSPKQPTEKRAWLSPKIL
jgi:hypothetical protein